MKEYVPVKFLEYLDVISGILEDGKREGSSAPTERHPGASAIFGALDEISLA
jgi:hypothetical protein